MEEPSLGMFIARNKRLRRKYFALANKRCVTFQHGYASAHGAEEIKDKMFRMGGSSTSSILSIFGLYWLQFFYHLNISNISWMAERSETLKMKSFQNLHISLNIKSKICLQTAVDENQGDYIFDK